MKTVIVAGDGSVSIAEAGRPVIGPRQALTRSIANGMCGSDVHIIKKAFKGITPDMYPVMLGHENVGEVVEIGSEVRGLKPGDKVILPFVDADPVNVGPYGSAWGGLSEYGVVNDPAAFPENEVPDLSLAQCIIPDDIDPVDAVMIVTFREVLSSVRYFGLKRNSPVVIFGSGPVALTFMKMCSLSGCSPVIAVVRNQTKALFASQAGADIVLNSSEIDVDKKIRELYPQGVPYVVDAVGQPSIVNEAMGLICDRGEVCCYGVPRQEHIDIDFSKADYNWVLNFQQMPRKDEEGKVHGQIIEWIREGKLDPRDFISDYFPFEKAPEAYRKAVNNEIKKKGVIVF